MPPVSYTDSEAVGLQQSRYKTAVAFDAKGVAQSSITDPAQVPVEVGKLREAFASDKTMSYEWRMAQLSAMERMITTERGVIQKALFADLHKNPTECNLAEIDFTLSEVHHAKRHLEEWMKPQPAPLSALNMPGLGATVSDPLGVVLVLGAWNYPFMLSVAPMVGAIAAGNCVVMKPGSYAPATSHVLGELIGKYLDPECIKVAEGDRHVTDALLKLRFDHIFYTGSGYVGKIVAKAAAEHLCPVTLELGGKSPAVVHKSANLDLSAERLVWGSFLNSGQTCIRPDFCLVDASIADAFLAKCKEKLVGLHGRNIQQSDSFGRIINHSAFDRLQGILDASRDRIVVGGETNREEKFVAPTILDYGTDASAFDACAAMKDEIFGPILPVLRFTDLERDVIQRIRALPTGKPLAMYVFAEDAAVQTELVKRTTAGGMAINDSLVHIINSDLPFGGVGPSGMGSYHGYRSFKTFSHEKTVVTKFGWLDELPGLKQILAARYPPHTAFRQWIITLVTHPTLEAVTNFVQRSEQFAIFAKLVVVALVMRKLGFRVTRD